MQGERGDKLSTSNSTFRVRGMVSVAAAAHISDESLPFTEIISSANMDRADEVQHEEG